MWSEDVLFTLKEACRTEALAANSLLAARLYASAELFTIMVDGEDTHATILNGAILQFLESRMFSGTP